MSNVLERVTKIVSEHLGVEEKQVTPESDLKNDLAADSLDIVELVMALEDEFDLQVSDNEVDALRTVGDVVTFIDQKTA